MLKGQKGTKFMLLGIAIILLGIAMATNDLFAQCLGLIGVFVTALGLFVEDKTK